MGHGHSSHGIEIEDHRSRSEVKVNVLCTARVYMLRRAVGVILWPWRCVAVMVPSVVVMQ